MFSIGGANSDDLLLAYAAWGQNAQSIQATVDGLVQFVNAFKNANYFLFDGIDIDYEVTGGLKTILSQTLIY
jgi:hypothetical protein